MLDNEPVLRKQLQRLANGDALYAVQIAQFPLVGQLLPGNIDVILDLLF